MAENGKVGRPRNLKSPEQMSDLFERYRMSVKSNPRTKMIATATGITPVPLEVPLTIVGFYNFCRNEVGSVHDYFEKPTVYTEFSGVCRAIREQVEQDQIEGGMVNIYNPSITQRLNGLTDKREDTIKADDNTLRIIVERMDGKK